MTRPTAPAVAAATAVDAGATGLLVRQSLVQDTCGSCIHNATLKFLMMLQSQHHNHASVLKVSAQQSQQLQSFLKISFAEIYIS